MPAISWRSFIWKLTSHLTRAHGREATHRYNWKGSPWFGFPLKMLGFPQKKSTISTNPMVDRVKYHPYFHKSRVKPLQFAKNFTHHSPGILGQAKSKGWPENLKQQKSKLIALHTVDGSEIPRPTTWDGAKTLVNKGRNGSQPQLVSCSRISLHHQLCMVPAASLSGKQQLSIFFRQNQPTTWPSP